MSYASANQLISDEPSGWRPWAPTGLTLLLPAITAIAFGWPTLDAGFQMGDDQRFVTDNVLVQHPTWQHVGEVLTHPHGDLYQPIPMLSFQATRALASREINPPSAFPYHLGNIILHALNAALAGLVAMRLSKRAVVGVLTGIMFATHPLALESVAWVSGRMMLLASFFSLMLLAIATRRHDQPSMGWRCGAIAVWIFACASKVIPTVPLVAALFERTSLKSPRRRALGLYGLLFLIGVAATVMMARLTGAADFSFNSDKSIGHLLGTALLAFGRYVENYIWPVNLSPWTPPLDGIDWRAPRIFLTTLGLVALLVFAWTMRRRLPVATAGLWMFVLVLAPFLAAGLTRRLFVADRYMYLPLLGLHLFVVVMMHRGVGLVIERASIVTRRICVTVPILALCAFWLNTAYALAPTWQSPVHFARRIVATHPNSVMAYNELARAYLHEAQPQDALRIIETARERWPAEPRLAAQAGRAYAMIGDLGPAQRELSTAVAAMPQQAAIRYEYALVLDRTGAASEAVAELQQILESHPSFLPAYRALTLIYRAEGRHAEEETILRKALDQNRYHRNNQFDLANIYLARGDLTAAEPLLRQILAMYPEDEPSLLNLGVILARTGRIVDAIKCYDQILSRSPNTVSARLNRAALLRQINQPGPAEADLRQVLILEPGNVEAAITLHELLFARSAWRDLISFWEQYDADHDLPVDCLADWMRLLEAVAQQETPIIPSTGNDGACHLLMRLYTALQSGNSAMVRSEISAYLNNPARETMTLSPSAQRLVFPIFETLQQGVRNDTPGLLALMVLLDVSGLSQQAATVLKTINPANLAPAWQPLVQQFEARLRTK